MRTFVHLNRSPCHAISQDVDRSHLNELTKDNIHITFARQQTIVPSSSIDRTSTSHSHLIFSSTTFRGKDSVYPFVHT